MAHSGKPTPETGLDSLNDRLRKSLSCSEDDKKDKNLNKPDFKELDLSSPVSPSRTRGSSLPATTANTTTTTTTSSSSSSSGSVSCRNAQGLVSKKSDSNHSGELSAESSPTRGRGFRPTHSRSHSGGAHSSFLSSGGGSAGGSGTGSSANSPTATVNVLPSGNICPSGRVMKTGTVSRASKTDVLGSGMGHYGHGSIMRGGAGAKSGSGDSAGPSANLRGSGAGLFVGESTRKSGSGRGLSSSSSCNDPEEFKRLGNESYKKGNFSEALFLYDKAIAISSGNAALHCNRAAALIGLKRLADAVRECEEAIRLDPRYVRAYQRLGSLLLSLGQVENARRHLCFPGHQTDPHEVHKLQTIEKHLSRCTDARRVSDWKSTIREAEAAISAGADNCPQLLACKAEALLKLHQLDDPDSYLASISKPHILDASYSQARFFGVMSDAYLFFVRAQIELALGRFENALTAAEKAGQIDPRNVEVSVLLKNVRMVSRARTRGNDLFKSERYTEACSAYGDGLRVDPSNSVLYCNRAACWHKLGKWELSVDDCNQALHIQPHYTKALLRRAASYCKLECWAEAVKDYEVLRTKLPYDTEVAESLFHAQVALKKSRGEDVSNMKFGGEVELISGLEQFRAAISSPEASVVHFLSSSNQQCNKIAPFLDTLCAKYPFINFLKVDVEESPAIANAENVRIVPTFKIYKKGSRVKEMVCPNPEVLESSVRHYSN